MFTCIKIACDRVVGNMFVRALTIIIWRPGFRIWSNCSKFYDGGAGVVDGMEAYSKRRLKRGGGSGRGR